MKRIIDFNEIKELLDQCDGNTKVYLGCDSERNKRGSKWYADYTRVIVIHKNGNNGCRLFGETISELDYDARSNKPTTRLFNEALKLSELYQKVVNFFIENEIKLPIELHLDLNPNKRYVSNHVLEQAIGYIKGTCNLEPKVKPEAWSASFAADRYSDIIQKRTEPA